MAHDFLIGTELITEKEGLLCFAGLFLGYKKVEILFSSLHVHFYLNVETLGQCGPNESAPGDSYDN